MSIDGQTGLLYPCYICVCYVSYIYVFIYKIYTYMSGILLSHKKDILPFVVHHTWMNTEDTMLSEMSQTLKDDYCTVSLKCGI